VLYPAILSSLVPKAQKHAYDDDMIIFGQKSCNLASKNLENYVYHSYSSHGTSGRLVIRGHDGYSCIYIDA
jgi:hypothetical protein